MIEKSKAASSEERGPLGDARPDATEDDPRTGGGQSAEDVKDRPNVGSVKPEDYPEKDRAGG